MIDKRNLTDADCERLAELVVPKLKASIMADLQTEAGKGLFALVRKAVFYIVVLLALYAISRDYGVKLSASALGIASPPPQVRPYKVLPGGKAPPDILAKAYELDRKIAGGL